MFYSRFSTKKTVNTFLLTAVLLCTGFLSFAHRVEYYTGTGCASGNTLTVTPFVDFAPGNTFYSWQYRDNSGVWKCFGTGTTGTVSVTINGTAFNVSGYFKANSTTGPVLSIANATTALENVQVRLTMADNAYPCASTTPGQIYGGDDEAPSETKLLRLHVYSSVTDCGGTTPGCIGNKLVNGSSYYGGFESMVYANNAFTNNNFGSNASTGYAAGGNNSTSPASSGSGTYQVLNYPYGMNSGNGKFAPHTGGFQMVIHGKANTQLIAWSKTVTVVPGTIYNFSAWVARTQGSNAFNLKLTVNGTQVSSAAVSTTSGAWNLVSGSYTVPAGVTSVAISIADVSTAADRFYSLDDICFAATSAVMELGNRVWYDANNNGINDTENGIAGLTVKLYKDADNNNVADGSSVATDVTDAGGYYNFTNLTPGNYIVGVTMPAGYISSAVNGGDPDDNINLDDNGEVLVGSEIRGLAITLARETENDGSSTVSNNNATYDFGLLPDCGCTTASSNLLVNGNFENGTTGWTATGGSLTTGTGYVACGAANGFNNWSSGTSKVYQDINAVPGAAFTFKGFAGTHTPGISCSPTLSLIFLKADGTVLGQSNVTVTRDVDVSNSQLEQYTITATAPALTAKVRVQSSITCNTMKIDAFCLTVVNPTFTIGNSVWNDVNNNGTQDSGEPGLPGATVKLYDCSGNYLNKTVTTDANGAYQFTVLPAGGYIIGVTTPAGYAKADVGTTNVSADNQNDGSVVAGTEVRTTCFNITGSTNNIDFGFKGTASIGDFVFNDASGNGIQNTGEVGIAGVTVTLTATGFTTQSVVTNASGAYSFTNLSPNTYTVTFTTPSGYTPTLANVTTTGATDANDSDPINGAGVTVTLTAGQANSSVDAGYYTQVSIGNSVWNDRNNNGIQDSGEPGIQGVVVKLYDCAGTYLNKTFTTDANGNYTLTGVAPGSYIVGVTTPSGYAKADVGTTNVSADNQNDGSVVAGTEVRTTCFVVTTTTTNIDFGLKGTGSIGDFVFNDANGNGIQDAGEVGISGATVILTYPGGATLTTTTNASGIYTFANIAPGTYSLSFTTPAGLLISPSNATGSTDANDSDPINGVVTGLVVTAGQVNNTVDAGFYTCVPVVSGINGPSTICAAEPALFTATGAGSGSVYNWTFQNGTPATATGSSVSSAWNTPGEYDITLTVTKNGCSATYTRSIVITQSVFAAAGPDAEICQGSSTTLNGTGPTGANYSWTVISGDPTSIDNGANMAGVLVSPLQTTVYQLTVTQNGCTRTDQITVNINVNKNPIADAGANKITLINTPVTIGGSPTGTPPLATPGAALGYTWTPTTGLNSSTVSNPTVTLPTAGTYNYRVIVYSIPTGCSDTANVTVTVLQPVSLGNAVWLDRNNNGIKDASEPGIGGLTVNLYADANNDNVADGAAIATTTTSTTGAYSFANLYPGNYITGVTVPAGYAAVATNGGDPDNNIDNDNNGTNTSVTNEVRTSAITLLAGSEPVAGTDGDDANGNQTIDIALRGTAQLGDLVWNDANRNGIKEATETGLAGVTVTLTYPGGGTVSTVTNASGIYNFANLAPGTYSLAFTTPTGYNAAPSNVATGGGTDLNDSDPINGVVSGIVLTAGQINTSVDAAYFMPISVSGNVWHDVNGLANNEINNTPGATPIPQNLFVYLVDETTNRVIQVESVNPNGTYSFADVSINKTYIITISTVLAFPGETAPRSVLPTNWIKVGENLGAGANSGSDGVIDGLLYIDTQTTNVTNANFGIKFQSGEIVVG